MSDKQWFVVYTKPRKECVAIENLERQGYLAYCPQIIQHKHRRNRWQKLIEPLFPRYLFVQLKTDVESLSPIRSTRGVVGVVRFGDSPARMPEPVIVAIHLKEQELNNNDITQPSWQIGDILEILDGPFAGLKGIFQKKESDERVILLLDILGQQNRASLNINSLMSAF